MIFELPAVRKQLPKIGDTVYSFRRTRAQVFAGLVAEGSSSGDDRLFPLAQFYRTLKGESDCERCVLRGDLPSECEMVDVCRSIRERREVIENLGLFASAKRFYETYGEGPRLPGYERYRDLFNRILGIKVMDRTLKNRIKLLFYLMTTESGFIDFGGNIQEPIKIPIKKGRDIITSTDLYLPIQVRIRSDQYREIVRSIIAYYRHSRALTRDTWEAFERSYIEFLELELRAVRDKSDHELTRCLLYLAFPFRQGDEEALVHSKRMKTRCLVSTLLR